MPVSKTRPRPRPGAEVDDVVRLTEALLSIFQQRLSTQIEGAFGEITSRRSQRRRAG
jgi:hypothetical protein